MFETAGLLLFIGVVLTIILIGLVLVLLLGFWLRLRSSQLELSPNKQQRCLRSQLHPTLLPMLLLLLHGTVPTAVEPSPQT